jgi:tRNA (mo5U34)-methyltransferase
LPKPLVFDRPRQAELRDASIEFLRSVISPWKSQLGLYTALDLGCGVGHYSAALKEIGFEVTGADARAQNVEEARSRHPGIGFRIVDAEDPAIVQLGKFDLVVCFGLLYHLENPLRAMRNLRGLTDKVLLLGSIVVAEDEPFLLLLDEPAGEDQSLRAVSCYPSEGAIIKMAYRAGFPHVYRFRELPNHEDFRTGVGRARARTMIAASVPALDSRLVVAAQEPSLPTDLWTTDPTGISTMLRRLHGNLKASRKKWRS